MNVMRAIRAYYRKCTSEQKTVAEREKLETDSLCQISRVECRQYPTGEAKTSLGVNVLVVLGDAGVASRVLARYQPGDYGRAVSPTSGCRGSWCRSSTCCSCFSHGYLSPRWCRYAAGCWRFSLRRAGALAASAGHCTLWIASFAHHGGSHCVSSPNDSSSEVELGIFGGAIESAVLAVCGRVHAGER